MNRKERLDRALKYFNPYELAKLTYERNNEMKIEIKDLTPNTETLTFNGNQFFTKEQLKQIERA